MMLIPGFDLNSRYKNLKFSIPCIVIQLLQYEPMNAVLLTSQ